MVLAALSGAFGVASSGPLRTAGTGWTSSLRPASAAGLGGQRGGGAMKAAWRNAADRAGPRAAVSWGLAADVPASWTTFSLPSAGTTTGGSATPPRVWVARLQDARAP